MKVLHSKESTRHGYGALFWHQWARGRPVMNLSRIAAWVLGVFTAVAGQSALSEPLGNNPTVIKAGYVVEPDTGRVIANQSILIEAGRIKAISADVAVPKSATVIDLSSSWVFPGLIDAHTHIGLVQSDATVDSVYLSDSSTFRALRGLHIAQEMLQAGFTTLRDLGNAGDYTAEDLRKAINAGLFDGPTLVTSGKIIAPFGGQTSGIPHEVGPFWHIEYLDADTPDELRKAIRTNLYYGADVVKLVGDQFAYHYSLVDFRAAVEEAHSAGKAVAVHVFGGQTAQNAIEAGVDSIEHGFNLTDAQLTLMKEKGTFLVPTDFPKVELTTIGMIPNEGKWEKPEVVYDRYVDRLTRAHKIGVKLAFGTDEFLQFPNRTRGEQVADFVDVWREAGLPARVILKAMTTNAAELLRINGDRGAIAVGLAADIVAASANPLENIDAIKGINFVMKDGKVVRTPD